MADEDRRAWQGVLSHIEGRLSSGEFGPGDRLPSERALATQLDVGRSSVREAMRVLEAMGLVRNQTGSGPTAGATLVSRAAGGMQALMRLQVAAQGFPVGDIVRTRLLLETAVAGELAEQASTAPVEGAERLLDDMDAAGLDQAEFLSLDTAFHVALAEAAGNQVVSAMMAGLRAAIENYVLEGTENIPDWPGMADRLRREHREILELIRAGRPAEARSAVHEHISGYYRDAHLVETAEHAGSRDDARRTESAHDAPRHRAPLDTPNTVAKEK